MSDDISNVARIINLRPGQSFAQTRFIPQNGVSQNAISIAQRQLVSTISSALCRAKEKTAGYFRIHSFHTMTPDCGVIVCAMVLREPEL